MRVNPGVSTNVSIECQVEPNRNCWQMSNNKCIAGDACTCTAAKVQRRSGFDAKSNSVTKKSETYTCVKCVSHTHTFHHTPVNY